MWMQQCVYVFHFVVVFVFWQYRCFQTSKTLSCLAWMATMCAYLHTARLGLGKHSQWRWVACKYCVHGHVHCTLYESGKLYYWMVAFVLNPILLCTVGMCALLAYHVCVWAHMRVCIILCVCIHCAVYYSHCACMWGTCIMHTHLSMPFTISRRWRVITCMLFSLL